MEHYLLFTGHMIDKPERKQKRFPKEIEANVRAAIKKYITKIQRNSKNNLSGIAGGACGGDILFHELCVELKISSILYLALPAKGFAKTSVAFAGKEWVRRFEDLRRKLPTKVMKDSKYERSTIWERANSWMLQEALKNSGENMTLLALWDGEAGDGGGGTRDMVSRANKENANVEIIDIQNL